MSQPYRVPSAQLTIEADGAGGRAPGAVRAWFASGFATLGGDLRRQVLLRAAAGDRLDRASRTPGGMAASLLVEPSTPVLDVPYSAASWARFEELLGAVPSSAALEISTHDADGRPGRPFLTIGCRTEPGAPGWRTLYLRCDDPRLTDTDDGQRTLLSFVRSVADGCNPGYGEISYADTLGATAYEAAVALLSRHTVPHSRVRARGHGWLTIVADEVAESLGGLDALRSTGAFHEVARLRSGGVWLLATPRWWDYREAEAARVFDVLGTVLPPSRVPSRPPRPVGVWRPADDPGLPG